MSGQPQQPASPQPPRSCLRATLLTGSILGGVLAAVGSGTGLCATEYRAGPATEAVLLAVGWGGPYGLMAGLVVGLLADWVRRRTRARTTTAGQTPETRT